MASSPSVSSGAATAATAANESNKDNKNNNNNDDDDSKFHFAIDRGGTFTDVYCRLPHGRGEVVRKLLSEDALNYPDAPTEGIRRVLHEFCSSDRYKRGSLVDATPIGSIRMGTTVATNALLERRPQERLGLLITRGFRDLLEIGNQSRDDIFDLTCQTPGVLYDKVVELDERLVLLPEKDETKSPLVQGSTGEWVWIAQEVPSDEALRELLQGEFVDAGISSLAVVLLHSYTFGNHEEAVGRVAATLPGLKQVALSSRIMPMVKAVPRGQTACAAAYLTPSILLYLQQFQAGFDGASLARVPVTFMKSNGGLTQASQFGGHEAIFSGPAGGVVGYAKTAYRRRRRRQGGGGAAGAEEEEEEEEHVEPPEPVIGFDMGGTSTDVSRYDGSLELVFDKVTAGICLQAPQLDIATVAAGGGSRLFFQQGRYVVGPESAGSHPGPVCYRKEGGQLAVTDANLILGRLLPDYFPAIFGPDENLPLDAKASRRALQQLIVDQDIRNRDGQTPPVEEVAFGFLQVANEAMCRPIRNLTQMKGHDVSRHVLSCFGGAGPQHACRMAQVLGMRRVLIHRFGGVLSAYGLSMADAVQEEQEAAAEVYRDDNDDDDDNDDLPEVMQRRRQRLQALAERATQALVRQGYDASRVQLEYYLNMRYQGTDNAIMIRCYPFEETTTRATKSPAQVFRERYRREFGFELQGRCLWIDDLRVSAVVPGPTLPDLPLVDLQTTKEPPPFLGKTRAYFEGGWQEVFIHDFGQLEPGHEIAGPAMIVQSISTIVLEPFCVAHVTAEGDLDITVGRGAEEPPAGAGEKVPKDEPKQDNEEQIKEDPVQLSIFSHRFMGIAEQMGRTLQRTSISVNIKERLDFSCALFTKNGGLVANAPHIPVHLGAMQAAVTFQVEYWNAPGREGLQEGDVLVSNHPQLAGGSHLPDITVITPVFYQGEIIFLVASRGHHADIGGIAPGSMPPHSTKLEEEGAMIVAFKLVRAGVFQEEGMTAILQAPGDLGPPNCATRTLHDNLSDLRAQVAANNVGIRLVQEMVTQEGLPTVQAYMRFIQENAERSVRAMLKDFCAKRGDKDKMSTTRVHAVDAMDDGSPICLTMDIDAKTGDAHMDFTGTGPQVLANHNAPPAVTYSAVIYSLRSLVGQDIPLNQGCLAPISFTLPDGSLLCPSVEAAVVGGNVLTSQRIVDVVLKAFEACAASQGCMNNLTFGDEHFGYYETIAGGAGAGPTWHGRSGVHTHCTNTRITDPEILERRYPVLLREFSLCRGSGGTGQYRGGDGVVRVLEPLVRPLVMSILSERRTLRPYGLQGGEDGKCGRNLVIRRNGRQINVGGRCSLTLQVGESLRIETPGGGGYGNSNSNSNSNGGDGKNKDKDDKEDKEEAS